VKPEQFRKVYIPMFAVAQGAARGRAAVRLAPAEHLHPPSAVLGRRAGRSAHAQGHAPLAVLPDNITTDHLSPSNAILPTAAAGEYLAKMGLPEEDFNSYATHRGDHLTAQRATFANPSCSTRWCVVDGSGEAGFAGARRAGRQGHAHVGSHRDLHGAQAAADHHRRADYGQGSSRDWAAKGVRLAGVEAIVAEGFERIHRTNLIGMGVLPLEFKPA
jgi:aconitate hydratase